MTRLSAGDYLLPGNDGETIFRIKKQEDGPSYGLDPEVWPRDKEFWVVYRWPKPRSLLMEDTYGYDPLADWNAWWCVSEYHDTRQQAIDAALRWEWERDNPVQGPTRKPRPIGSYLAVLNDQS